MSDTPILRIENLHAKVADEDLTILKGLDLELPRGEVHAIMGPNGSGKSTLAKVLTGHPGYLATKGAVTFDGRPLLELEPHERARAGIFLAFQYPVEIPGVSIANFLRTAMQSRLAEANDERGEVSTEILYVAGIAIALIGVVAAIQAGLMGKVGQIFGG